MTITGAGTLRDVTGGYGSIEVDGGGTSSWEGYSIGGRAVFMHDNSSTSGLFNDVNDQWLIRGINLGAVELYHSGSKKFETTSSGVEVTGLVTADGVRLGDNQTISFGTGNDLEIYHNGTNSLISEVGTGDLIVYTNGAAFQVDSNTGENMIYAAKDAGVNLYHNNIMKLQTTSNGANIDGDINAVNNIYLAGYVFHEGDTDTYMEFHNDNQWRVVTGGSEMLEVNDSYVLLGANSVGKVNTNSVTGSVAPDFYGNNSFVWTLTGNLTLSNPSTEVAGMSGVFVFIQDATGGRTVSLGTDYETAGGAGLTLSTAANAVDIVPYFVQSSGNILLGTPQLAFA